MPRTGYVVAALFACSSAFAAPPSTPTTKTETQSLAAVGTPFAVQREQVSGDIYHYTFDIRVGSAPNARLRIHRVVRERAPGLPRPSSHAILLLHGDFATFVTNFLPGKGTPASSAPGLAPYLAAAGVDTWGLDRRWTLPGTNDDVSDFGDMGVDQELGDVAAALAFARATRLVTDGDGGRITLGGFSHGAELTYAYAAGDGRHVSAIAPIDIYYDLAPADAALRDFACANAATESAALAAGQTDQKNQFFIDLGVADRQDPDGDSQYFPTSNRGALFWFLGLTYQFAPYTPLYHLAAPVLDSAGNAVGLSATSEDAASAWLAGAPPHSSMREQAELDAIWCGQTPRAPLANIRVPLYYLGAAGAFGAHGLYSTTQVSSTDVTTHVVQRLGDARQGEDVGHGDLLYGKDADKLAWKGLAGWLLRH